jgi:hypothetical protein
VLSLPEELRRGAGRPTIQQELQAMQGVSLHLLAPPTYYYLFFFFWKSGAQLQVVDGRLVGLNDDG